MAYTEDHIEKFKILLRKYPNERRQRQLQKLCLAEYGFKPSLGKVNDWLNKFGNLKKIADKKTEHKLREKGNNLRKKPEYMLKDPELLPKDEIVVGKKINGLNRYAKAKNELVFIYYTKGYTVPKIAEMLQMPESSVRYTIYQEKFVDGKTMKQLYAEFLKEGVYEVRDEIKNIISKTTMNGIYRASMYDDIKTMVYEGYYNMHSDNPEEQIKILKERAYYISNIAPKTTDALTQELMGIIEFSEKVDMSEIVKELAEETGINLDEILEMVITEEKKRKDKK